MRNRLLFSTMLGMMALGSVSTVKAEDDVYFDMSALDGLSPAASESAPAYAPDYEAAVPAYQPAEMAYPVQSEAAVPPMKVDVPLDPQTGAPVPVRQEPQFPVYVKPKVAPKKPAPAPKKVVKIVEEAPKPEPVAVPVEEELIEEERVTDELFGTAAQAPVETKTEAPAAVEPAPEPMMAVNPPAPSAAVPAPAPVSGEPKQIVPVVPAVEEPVAVEPEAAAPENIVNPQSVAPQAAEPLIPASIPANQPKPLSEYIRFDDDSITLSEANKQKLDAVLASFANPDSNKISILSYNYDDGQDAFKKKRQSLDRAVEVRAYLLSKGYKNFNNIKVININNDINKKNVVEIKE